MSAVNQERLGDGIDAVVVEELVNVGGGEALAVGHEEDAVFAVDSLGQDHAGDQFGEEDFALFAGDDGLGGGALKQAHGLGIESRTAALADEFGGLLGIEPALGEGHRHGQEAGEPGDGSAFQAIRITAAVETFVMGTDDGTNALQTMHKARQFLGKNGMMPHQGALGFVEAFRGFFPTLDELAGQADQADVVDGGADFQNLLLGGVNSANWPSERHRAWTRRARLPRVGWNVCMV